MSSDEIAIPVIVVGGGGAGMVAAITAANNGYAVMLLEKSTLRGCNTEWSGGLVQAAGTRIQRAAGVTDSPQAMFQDIMKKSGYKSDPLMVAAIAQRAKDVINLFLDEVGMDLHLDQNVLYYGHTNHRMHATASETGSEIVQQLRTYIGGYERIDFVNEAEFVGAEPHEQGWKIHVRHGGRHEDALVGRKLVLACDGFGGNRDMLRIYCPAIAEAEHIGSENNTGTGIQVAERLGAALDLMTAYQGHSHVNPSYGTRLGGLLPSLGSIMVNSEGRRFEREDQGYSEFAKFVLAQPGGTAVEVYDHQAHEAAMATGSYRDAVEAGAVKSADTLEGLAKRFHVPVEAFVAEVERYSAEVAGTDWLGRSDERHALQPPFYGAVVTGAIAHTQGGVRIDTACHALTPENQVISDLLVAGGTAAGISGDDDTGYLSGNGLIQAFVTGLIAGETATRELLAASVTEAGQRVSDGLSKPSM